MLILKLEELKGCSTSSGAYVKEINNLSITVGRFISEITGDRRVINEIPRLSDEQVIKELNAMGFNVMLVELSREHRLELDYLHTFYGAGYIAKDLNGACYSYAGDVTKHSEKWRGDDPLKLKCDYTFLSWTDELPVVIGDVLNLKEAMQ